MNLQDLLSCNDIRLNKNDEVLVTVDNVKLIFTFSINFSLITEIILKCKNYKSNCRIIIDTRTEKVIAIETQGFKEEKIKKVISECFREKGILYKQI
ncbi:MULTISPECIES: hypothetical protein [Acidianus]|uniref:Uncharacterized protein n=1 Tax=Candidatus Acidianus copahuensis TaxID=1160895 RepID=A0A031LKX5_9CREN|nr:MULTISPECIES: hypothetical protein [Acidianus]EZQ01839.1 hypothetical protein CM19_11900 [Candidatus Acidianus copahuensis]NON62644.1 hypothetical protein [Acidianus sp. RZ1]